MDSYMIGIAFMALAFISFIASLSLGFVINAIRLQIKHGNGNEVYLAQYRSLLLIRLMVATAGAISLAGLIFTVT